MDVKRTVAIDERDGVLFLGDKKYRAPLRGDVSLTVSDLTVHLRADYDLENKRVSPGVYALSGTGHLKDGRLEVLGDPDSWTQELSVSLHSASPNLGDWKTEDGRTARSAFLGFSKADWEISDKEDSWWIQIYFPAETIERVVTALRAGLVASLTVGAEFANVYIDPDEMPLHGRDLFLRPGKETGDPSRPETAEGTKAWLHLVENQGNAPTRTASRNQPSKPESEGTQRIESEASSADIAALTTTIKVFGCIFVVLAILALIFK